MKILRILVLCLFPFISIIAVETVLGLPYDAQPPKCYLCCDVNYDGQIDLHDVSIVARSYGSTEYNAGWNPAADINMDGTVDLNDVMLVVRCLFRRADSQSSLCKIA